MLIETKKYGKKSFNIRNFIGVNNESLYKASWGMQIEWGNSIEVENIDLKTIIKNIGNKNIKAKVEEPLSLHVETLFILLSNV